MKTTIESKALNNLYDWAEAGIHCDIGMSDKEKENRLKELEDAHNILVNLIDKLYSLSESTGPTMEAVAREA